MIGLEQWSNKINLDAGSTSVFRDDSFRELNPIPKNETLGPVR